MKKTLGILAIALFSLMLFQHCQKSDFLVVTGVVRDSLTNQPLENVYIFNGSEYVVTGKDGIFSFQGARSGKVQIAAYSLNGYKNQFKSVIINEGQINKHDFNLSPIQHPEIETKSVQNIRNYSATVVGFIENKSNEYIYNYGHCWSNTSTIPTLEENTGYTNLGGSSSTNISFSSNLSGLKDNIIYYVRSYAIIGSKTIYGNVVAFKTEESQGLIMYLPFDGSYNDVSGNGFYTYQWWTWPSLVADRFGNPNKAVEFQAGISDELYFNRWSTEFQLYDFSISLWFYKPTNWEAQSQKMFTIGYPWVGIKAYISQGAAPNNINCGINTGGVNANISLPSYPSVNKWHHIVLQRQNTQLSLYLDGNLVGKTTCNTSQISNYDGWMFLGFTWLQEPFRGRLDDLRIYDHALSHNEIQHLYNH